MMADNTGPLLKDRLIESVFTHEGGQLVIGGISARELTDAYGTPLFVYDADVMRRTYRRLATAVAGFAEIYFSVKANPNPAIARIFSEEGAGLEIASGGEFVAALRAGGTPERMLFAGPGKGDAELEFTLGNGLGEIHLETFEEIESCAQIGAKLNRPIKVAIRINPSAAAQGGAMRMGGKPSGFGFDEETVAEVVQAVLAKPSLELTGIHLFTGTQILDAKTLLDQWAHAIKLAGEVARLAGKPLETIDLGGGLGVPYHAGDKTLDLAAVADGVPALSAALRSDPNLMDTNVIVEPGRYLTAEAGAYLVSVRAVKMSRGSRFIITDGGMHHHLAASGNLGQVVKRDYPLVAANKLDASIMEQASVIGPLCTPLDTVGRQTQMPEMQKGDIVAILQSGAYGLTASPTGFLSHPMPAEVLVEDGKHRIIRQRGSFENLAAPLVD